MEDFKENKQDSRGFDPIDMESLPAEEQMVIKLHKVHYGLRHNAESRGGQGRILSLLLRRGGISQRELMDIVSVRAGSLSEVLGKLEENGWISRAPNEEDRRRADITLTPEGEAAARAMEESRKESRKTFFSPLNEEEKAQLNSLLDKLSANIDWPDEAERRRHHGCGKHGHEGQGHGCHGHEGHDHCDHHGHHGHHGHHCHQGGSDKD